MRLFIAEKKEVAEAISVALSGPAKPSGSSFKVGADHITWLWGHQLRLSDPEEHDRNLEKWSLSALPMVWPISLVPEERQSEHLKAVITLAKQAKELINAGDPDPEGQRIVDEVIEYAGLTSKPVKRILINDNNAPAILKALQKMEDNSKYKGLSMSALARAVCDQRYGYNLTRCYTLLAQRKGYEGVLSVGRVQTPILGLVVRRDRLNEGHNKQTYYVVQVTIDVSGMELKATFQPGDGAPLDEKGRIINAAFAQSIVDAVSKQTASIESIDTKERKQAAPLPYNILALQADAAGLWGYKPKAVLEITQRLRDRHKAITYNRSDCRYLNDERHEEATELLAALTAAFGEIAEDADPRRKSKAFDSAKVGAHHAIIPTLSVPDMNRLGEDERRIYDLIARSYIAQFYPPEQFRTTSVLIQAKGHQFKSTGRVDISPGWRSLYTSSPISNDDNEDEPEDSANPINLEQLKEGESGLVREGNSIQKYTKPPALYTMKTLLKDLACVAKYVTDEKIRKLLMDKDADKHDEAGGIGTPATRDSHIETLFTRGFLAEKEKNVISTDLGRNFYDALPEFAVKPDLTALWHEKQKDIEKGALDYQELINEVDKSIADEVARVMRDGLVMTMQDQGIACPTCKEGRLKRRKGKNGFFWGCSRFPECTASAPDKRGKPDLDAGLKKKEVSSLHKCMSCGSGLTRRPGKKRGTFWWGCSGFPSCKQTYPDSKGKPDYSRK